MKVFVSPALITVSALAVTWSVHAQQAPANQQQQPAQQSPQASPATTGQKQAQPSQPTAQPGAATTGKQQPSARAPTSSQSPPAQPQELAQNQAAAASAERRPLLSRPAAEVASDATLPGSVRAVTKDMERRVARALDGGKVRGTGNQTLGKVKDFMVDTRTGEISCAVVIGERDRLRLVPFKALKPDRERKNDFTLPMKKEEWDKLGSLNEADFEAGRITISDSQRRDLAQRFERAQSGTAATGSAYYTPDANVSLVRVGTLRGRDVFIDENKVGTLEDVIIDQSTGAAYALFDPSWRFTASKKKLAVPLNRYSFGTTGDDRITTTITRADFNQFRTITQEALPEPPAPSSQIAATAPATTGAPAGAVAQSPTPAAPQQLQPQSTAPAPAQAAPADQKTVAQEQTQPASPSTTATSAPATTPPPQPQQEPELAPTGRTTSEQQQTQTPATSDAAVKAIRAALAQSDLSRIDVNANPDGSIVLRGTAPDEQLKKTIEEKAQQAAGGAKIDSQITVEKQPASSSREAAESPQQPSTPSPSKQ